MEPDISPDLKKELDQIQALEKDNNRMLRSIRRSQWFSTLWTVLVWAIAISLPLYLYQAYVQPIVSKFYVPAGSATTTPAKGLSFPSSTDVQKLLNSFVTGK